MCATIVWRFCLYLFLSLSLNAVVCPQAQHTVWFQPDTEYTYKYEGFTHIKDVALIKVAAQLLIAPLGSDNETQLCRLTVDKYDIRVNQDGMEYQPEMSRLKLNGSMTFDMTGSGEIRRVFYPEDEDPVSLTLKKIILGTLSSKLVVSDSNKASRLRWAYRVNETGHEGTHSAVYHANPLDEEIVFTKVKQTKALENADQDHTKVIRLDTTKHIPVKVITKESFHSPNELAQSYRPTNPESPDTLEKGNTQLGLPKMGGTSTSLLMFVRSEPIANSGTNYDAVETQSEMKNGTLKVEPIPPTKVSLSDIQKELNGNMSCIVEARKGDIHTGLPCFRQIITMLKRLSREDINKVTTKYLQKGQSEVVRQTMIDALGTAHTPVCYTAMMQHVFHAKRPEAELLMRALFQLVDLSAPTPEIVFSTLEFVVFHRQFTFVDEELTQQVIDRTTLVLASVAKKVQHSRSKWSSSVVRRLEQRVGVHDPYHHRQLRSTMTEKEEHDYLNWRTLHIHALGNAAHDSSLGYLESYLNDSSVHIALRSSAVDAIAKYKHKYIADVLLSVALTDQEENVRLAAVNGYKRHPFGGDIRTFLDPIYARSHNITQVEHSRMRRSLSDSASRIWKGLKFRLESPSVHWVKHVGGSKLGASMGVIFRNLLDIQIRPLQGHIKVDVLDSAWATIHVGIIGFDFDIFRAELCFKGGIEYGLNILKEYGYEEMQRFAELYKKIVNKVIKTLKESAKSFKSLVSTFKNTDFNDIIKKLIESVKQLPRKVLNLRRVGKRMYKAIGKFVELPPVVTQVKDLITKVKTLFSDIKTDVMQLYNAVADSINTVVPWAWKEIKVSFNGIVKAIKKLLKNPRSAIQEIGEAIARISAAIAGVIDAKHKIEEANFFAKENRPYWFDIKKELKDIWTRVEKIKTSIVDTMAGLKNDPSSDKFAKTFTGVDLTDMKSTALREIKAVLVEELDGPLGHLKQLLEPFQQANDFFKQTVKNVKEAWRVIRNGYQTARTMLEEIFGPRMHEDFPRKLLESRSCGDGFWETDGKGRYAHKGIMLEVTDGQLIVAPYGGQLKKTGSRQITITVADMKNVTIVIDNIDINVVEKEVAAGETLGQGKRPSWCIDPHVHVAVVKIGTGTTLDPTGFLRKRKMPPPRWVQECDHYVLRWLGDTISQGKVLASTTQDDTTPAIDGTTEDLHVDAMEDSDRKKRGTSELVDKINDFAKSLGLPDMTKLKEVFNFNMNSITLSKVLGYIDKVGLSKLKTKILHILKEIEKRTNHQSCINPETMEDAELKQALVMRGRSASGARQTLIDRYLTSDPQCFDIGSRVGQNVYCRFDETCTSVSCCVDLKLFIYRHTLTAFVRYDPCDLELTIGINTWTTSFTVLQQDFTTENNVELSNDVNALNVVQLMLNFKIERTGDVLKISLGVAWCSTRSDQCMGHVVIMADAKVEIGPCVSNATLPVLTRPADTPNIDAMLNMKIGDVIKLVDVSGIDEKQMVELVEDLREAFQQWLTKQIENLVVKIFGNEFERFDVCTTGAQANFGPYYVEIYELDPPITIPVGPILLQFRFGIDGHYGATFYAKLCFMTMKASATIVPRLGSSVWGSVGVSVLVLRAELRLTGYLLTTSFPTTLTVEYKKFPLDVRARMDLNLIPLRIELRAMLIFHFCIYIPWKGRKCWNKKLINHLLWHYQTRSINKNLLNYNDAEPDLTAPDFGWYKSATCTNCDDDTSDGDDDTSGSRRRRRTIGPSSTGCHVTQLEGRDYTEPAFNIEFGVADDRSEVELSYCVGTFSGGCDVIDNEPLGGGSTVVVRKLAHSIRLYFRVKAQNSMGLSSTVSCEMPTYDMTLPEGRITPDFRSTSRRDLLQGSALALDDSDIVTQKISAGYGKGSHGTHIVDWQSVASVKAASEVDTGDDPLGLRLLEHFTAPREGRLVATPVKTTRYQYAEGCARDCLSHPATVCLSFNYDYDSDSDGECQLMNHVEGHDIHVRLSGRFHHFERLGIGHVTYVKFTNLTLTHNTTTYLNYYLQNVLEYKNIISSSGVLVDLTPPSPGVIKNAASDSFTHDTCKNYVPKLWQQRCAPETTYPTHRTIVDGDGSLTIFNGHEPTVDQKYTRANRMIAGNWDGIRDNETGILMYTWAVGTSPCGDDIVTHNDPHEHIASASEWTNVGLAFPLKLPDNKYYVTVRAISNIEFGPLALTVCHSLPYAIDTTPPVIHAIYDVTYDEDALLILFRVNATDPVSGIKSGEVGLGRSRRDTYLLPWTTVQNYSHVELKFRVPDGVPAWVKMRVTNYVDLSAVGHSDKAIIVDMSPPIPGLVYDSNMLNKNIAFQFSSTKYCSYWQGFRDPESGISKYLFELGTSPGSDDVVANTVLSYTVTSHCVDGLELQHKRMYYCSITAFNGGLVEKNVTVYSDGVYVDVTPPLKGIVKDGEDPNIDAKYSSEASTVASTWNQFSDPESGIKSYHIDVYRTPAGSNSQEFVMYTNENVEPSVSSMVRHHFHLHHGDAVRVEVTAANKADSTTSATSDGLKIDLTQPKMSQLVDGGDLDDDMQYTDSTTSLTASWSFVDPESGIVHYKISAYELHGGKWTPVYPKSAPWKTIPGGATTWTTDEPLTLKIGARYKMRVSAVNGAGLTAVHYTDGVVVDPTPPKMVYVHAGVLSGESEELVDGYVVHNDENGIQASWRGRDVESGVKEYFVSIGTSPGKTDLLEFRSMGLSKDGYIDNVNLTLTNELTNTPVYYVTVKARNGAGKESVIMSSSPIKVVSGDVAGVVRDGPDSRMDIDYQLDLSTVTVTFSGYESQRDGVSRYEWAVGSAPRFDDVMPYSDVNLVTHDGGARGMLGLGGSGHAQGELVLSAGRRYYTSVRAVTGAGGLLESTSDSFLVDVTAPSVVVTAVGVAPVNTTDTAALYQRETVSYTAAWRADDQESGLGDVAFRLGTYPDADDIHRSKSVTNITSFPNGYVTPRTGGTPNILSLVATNGVGLKARRLSPVLVVDVTPPGLGTVNCPKFVQGGDSLECSWSGFVERESEVDYYKFGVGKAEGDDSVYVFHRVAAGVSSHRATGLSDGGLKHKETYYVTVIAVNKVGLKSVAYSKPLVVDDTPPQGGLVVELSETRIILTSGPVNTESNVTQERRAELTRNDAICQRALTQVLVAWEPFVDTETEVTRYQVAIGSTPGGTQLRRFEDVKTEELTVVVRGLDLSRERHVFATVKGFNAAGLHSTATSDGVYVSLLSSGKTPLGESYVYDGNDKAKDVDFQDHNDGLSAHWDFSGDPCPIEKFEWAIQRFDGKVVLNLTELPAGATEAEADELPLKDGESYFVVVRATNKLGYIHTVHSNGITVQLEPLLPGNVRDGDIFGKDLNFQQSVTSISANWDGFGQPKFDNNGPVVRKVSAVAGSLGKHQQIEHYEVAVGSDRRFHSTRTNIRPFTNVGLNHTWTFSHLKLVPHAATYYVTVRAYSVSSAVVEVTSNGIKVGYGSPVISTGTLEIAKYIHSTTDLSFSWSGFKFLLPVKFYVWGMRSSLSALNCSSMVRTEEDGAIVHNANYSHLFDVQPLTRVDLNTYVKQSGLGLTQGKTYHVVVIATDEAGGCVDTSGAFTVDITPPEVGHLGVGPERDMKLLYSPHADTLTVWWTGFNDPESGIKSTQIRLLDGGESCKSRSIGDMTTVVDFTEISTNSSSYEFANLKLKESVTYFLELLVTNGAELTRSALSRPVLLDVALPTAGAIKHGDNFKGHITYQNSVTDMKGVFLYLPTAIGAACPRRMYSMSSADSHWTPLVHKYLRAVEQEERQDGVEFHDFQLSYTEKGLGVTLRRDVTMSQMLSGAIQTDADINRGATYSFEIKAACGSMRAVTSVVFFDGPKGVFADYTPVLFHGDTPRLVDSGRRSNGLRIVDTGLPGDTALNVPELKQKRGFGFQIHPNATYEGQSSDWIVLWATTLNETMHTVSDFDFNPTDKRHVYKLVVTGQEEDVDEIQNWELKLYIDGRERALLAGAANVSDRTQMTLGVYNRHGWVTPLKDVFHPPQTTAVFSRLEFPAASTKRCRFGDPFRGSARPVVEFQAAIGTKANADDVSSFQKITHPCIPCQHACDRFICNTTCKAEETQVVHINVTGLALNPMQTGAITNESYLQPYYIIVKAITGSGRSVTASSGGIYIDISPPVFTLIFHVDLSWSQTEQSTFQGDNSSIAVYYEVFDNESKVVENWWAIGSTPGGADVQPLTSIGTESFVVNRSLEGLLLENHTYYVTLVSINGAGLKTSNTSQGVTILTVPPKADNITTVTENTKPFDSNSSSKSALKTSRQDSVGVAWEKPPSEEDIDGVYFSVGSEDGKDDIYPRQQVGVGDHSGEVVLSSGGIKFTGGNETTVFSGTGNRRRKRDLSGDFLMEPGRTMRVNLRACNKAHICSRVPVKPILIVRDKDTVAESKYGQITLKLKKHTTQNSTVVVKTTKPQEDGTLLVGGFLSTSDVQSQYLSAASDKFESFIVDPEATKHKTDRYLRNIIHRWDGQSMYIATLPDQTIEGPLSFTVWFDKTRENDLKQDSQPRILRWCADEEMWIDAGRTCDTDGSNSLIDWENGLVTVKVCHSANVCRPYKNIGKTKRSAREFINSGVAEYAVASTDKIVSNSPPVIVSDMTIHIDEDERFVMNIIARDSDGDGLVYLLNATAPAPRGHVTLAINGRLSYTPCSNCYGNDTIHFTVMEKKSDYVIQPLSVDGTLVVEIRGTNDAPVLHMFKDGRDVVPPSSRVMVTVEENSSDNSAYKDMIFILAAHDVDYTDDVNMTFDTPKHGNLTVYTQVKNVDLIQQDCSKSWDARRHLWDKLVDGFTGSVAIQKLLLPNPCDTDFMSRHFAWVITAFRYTPFEEYFGDDTIKVKAADLISQQLLTINVKVLRNPCINRGVCEGPESDQECKSTNRSTGFAGYTCRCPPGYGGDYCEIDIDECLSSPCETNLTCIDRVNGYECYCHPDWPCHGSPSVLKTWQIVLISVGCFLVVFFVGLCLFYYWISAPKRKFIQCTDSASSSSNGNHGRHRPDWIHGGPSSQNFLNPAYDATMPLNDTLTVDPGQHARKAPRRFSSTKKTSHRPTNEVESIPDYE